MEDWISARRGDQRPASLPEYDRRRLPPAPAADVAGDLVCIDLEASSLFATSYPIEFGWASLDLSGGSFLIKPAHRWTAWSFSSETVHGIKRPEAVAKGLSVRDAAWRVNQVLAGKTVLCDTVDADGTGGTDHGWLVRLFEAACMPMRFRMAPMATALCPADPDPCPEAHAERLAEARSLSRTWYPRTHKAGEDAISMAAEVRLAADDAFLAAVREHDARRRCVETSSIAA